jgi:glycosyltransferase involved in cell wall biosynthesis
MERNRRLLNLRYPYDAIIEAFIAADPIHPVRRRLDEARLTAAGQKYVLIVTSGLAGGVARFVGERVRTLSADGATPLVLKPDAVRPDSYTLLLDGSELHDLRYQLPGDLATLRALFSRLQFRHIELHHFLGHDGALVDELLALGIDYDIYVHDNSWVCPRLTLLGGDGRYCGEPDLAGCTACIATYGSSLNEPLSTAELRQRSARWLGQARDIVVPSRDLASRLNRYFAGLAPQVTPWETDIEPQRLPSPLPQSPTRVAVIGAIGEQKGYRIVLACACDAAARSLPLEFVVIGYTQDDDALLNTGKAFVTGQYDEPEIDDLLRRERPRVAFFPSVTPESWCYTLSHALRAGLPIVAFDLGAIAERLRVAGLGKVVPVTTDAAQLNDLLLAEAADVASSGIKKGSTKLAQSDPSAPELPTTEQPSASVQAVTIAEGLYAFRVRAGAPARSAGPDGLLLPAINVGIAPGQPANIIEFMPGPRTEGNWLCEPGHALVARVSRQPATFLLTSLRVPDGPLLSIAIDRLDQPNHGAGDAQHLELPARPPTVDLSALQPPRPPGASKDIRTDGGLGGETQLPGLRAAIMAHIQRWGDTQFIDVSWAGYIGQHLWIEAFSINPLENITADQIEYKGLTAAGYETPWLSNRAPCGTRGMAMPLVGFAVRIKPSAGALAYDCEYSGAFISGATIGPRRNGAPCFSTPDDPLEAIQLKILARGPSETAANGGAEPQQPDVSATLRPVEQSRRGRTLRSATTRANARVAAKQP